MLEGLAMHAQEIQSQRSHQGQLRTPGSQLSPDSRIPLPHMDCDAAEEEEMEAMATEEDALDRDEERMLVTQTPA